jgi:hypothetical protein
MTDKYIKQLISAHWKYVKGVILSTVGQTPSLPEVEYHYKTAFEHGFKHGVEYAESED